MLNFKKRLPESNSQKIKCQNLSYECGFNVILVIKFVKTAAKITKVINFTKKNVNAVKSNSKCFDFTEVLPNQCNCDSKFPLIVTKKLI